MRRRRLVHPARIDKKIVDTHCGMLKSGYDEYKREWIDVARPVPREAAAGRPAKQVVYPFGGGDLVTRARHVPGRDGADDDLPRDRR